jgi:multisubunit Na+/H+ antiporter MnhE subunit
VLSEQHVYPVTGALCYFIYCFVRDSFYFMHMHFSTVVTIIKLMFSDRIFGNFVMEGNSDQILRATGLK